MKDRALRRHNTRRVIKNRVKIAKEQTGWGKVVKQPHRLAKRHPCDCGKPQCMCCHYDKILGNLKISDIRKILGKEETE